MARRVNLMGVEGSVWRMDESAEGTALDRGPRGYHLHEPFDPYIHWDMNGDLVNSSRGPDGTIHGGTGTYAAGKLNQALFLDGIDDYVDLNGGSLSLDGRAAWSWSAWVYADASNAVISGWGRCVMAFGGASAGHYLYYDGDNEQFEGAWVGDSWHSGVGTYPHSNWYHVAVTYDGATLIIYIDNVAVRTVTVSLNLAVDGFRMGLDQLGEARYFKGGLDDVRIFYHGTLDTARVAELWNTGSGTEADLADKGGGTPTVASGQAFDYARDFDRSNSEFLETYQPIDNEQPFISAWVKLSSLPSSGGQYPICATYYAYTGDYGFIFEVVESGGDLVLRIGSGDGTFTYLSYTATGVLNTVDWFHVACYLGANGSRLLYLDGMLVGRDTAPDPGYLNLSEMMFTVGNFFAAGGSGRDTEFFDGQIADLCVSDHPATHVVNLLSAISDPQDGLQPTERTIACYNFDGAGAGDDDAGNHPAVANGVVYAGPISGKVLGRSASPGPLLTIPHHADFDDPMQPLTIEAWVYVASGAGTIVEKGDGTNLTFSLRVSIADSIVAEVKDSDGIGLGQSSFSILRYAWTHVAFTWNPAVQTIQLSYNGRLRERKAWGFKLDLDLMSNTEDILVGSGTDGDLNGAVCSLRFNRELRPNPQIQASIDGRRFLIP